MCAQATELPRTPSPPDAEVYIISPVDGATVSSPVKVKFGLKGMGVAPAGTVKENTGHHHLLIDGEEIPPDNLPMGAQVKHFGGGQTEVTVDLESGTHTLQLILGDALHIQHDPPVISKRISITVE
ncbi:MAG: DUF4399 domain-containing protein [Pseudomonadota bacterium]